MPPDPQTCTRCYTTATPVVDVPGETKLEALAWCLLVLPGMLYTTWRLIRRGPACPVCGSRELVPPDSPRGADIARIISWLEAPAEAAGE